MKWPILKSCGWNKDSGRYNCCIIGPSCNEMHDVVLVNVLSFIKQETLHNCRHERCKKRVGNQGGLLRKKAAALTVILEGTGRVGKRGTGNPVLTFLVKSQPILMLTQIHKFSSLFTWDLYLLPLPPRPFDQNIHS